MIVANPNAGLARKRSQRVGLCLFLALAAWITIRYFHGLRNLGDIDSAIFTLRTTVDAENRFAERHADEGYTCKLTDLGSNEMLRLLAQTGQRNGYAFQIICSTDAKLGPRKTYQVTADPLHSKLPAYCVDQSGIVRYDEEGSSSRCLRSGSPL